MKVVITSQAQGELDEIWSWNVEDKGIRLADAYLEFLKKSILTLSKTYSSGRIVATRPDFRFVTIKRSSGGHGHILVYMIEGLEVVVLHVFHTAQDWEIKLS